MRLPVVALLNVVVANLAAQATRPETPATDDGGADLVLIRIDEAVVPERRPRLRAVRAALRTGDPTDAPANLAALRAHVAERLAPVAVAIEHLGGTVVADLWLVPGLAVRIDPERAALLATLPGVVDVAPNRRHAAHVAGATNASNHDVDRVQQVNGLFGAGATIAILDSGLDLVSAGTNAVHPAFLDGATPARSRVVAAYGIASPGQTEDQNGHGTAVAAIAAGRDWGVRFPFASDHGFAPAASIASYKITQGATLFTDDLTTVLALQQIAADRFTLGIGVVSHSYGGSPDPLSQPQIATDTLAFYFDVLVVTSAGNFVPGQPVLPTAFSQANVNGLAVGAVHPNTHAVHVGSSYGPLPGDPDRHFPDLVACGVGIRSAQIDTTSVSSGLTGTSFAAPMVAGSAAVVRGANPQWTALDVKALLLNTVADLSARNPTLDRRHYGLGLLRTDLAVDAAIHGQVLRGQLVPALTYRAFQVSVVQGQRYAATLAWHRSDVSGGDWDDLSLAVFNDQNRLVAITDSPRNLYERVLFQATSTGLYTLVAGTDTLRPQPGNLPLDISIAFSRNGGGGRQPGDYTTFGGGCAGSATDAANGIPSPPAAGGAFGLQRSRVPFAWSPHRLQQSFASNWFPQTRTIRAIAVRRDEVQVGAPAYDADLEIAFAYTARPPGALDSTFANNPIPGTARTVLGRRNVRFPGAGGVPRDHTQWDYVIPLDQPFTVQTTPGRALLLDVRLHGHSQNSAPFDLWFDAFDDPNTCRVFSSGSPQSPVGGPPENRSIAWSFLVDGGASGARPDLQAVGVPQLGETFGLVLRHAPPFAPAALVHGFSNSVWGGAPLPFDLTALGAPGCTVLAEWDATISLATSGAGVAEIRYSIPNQPVLTGLQFYNQFLVLDGAANVLGLTLSNAGEAIVGG